MKETIESLQSWYEILEHHDPKSEANFEFENNTGRHSVMLFLKGALEELRLALDDEEDQHEALFALCHFIDNQVDFFNKLGVNDSSRKAWALFETDLEGNPIRRLDGLHYSVEDVQ